MSTTPQTPPATSRAIPQDRMSHRQVLEALSGLLLGLFVAVLSSTVVSNALPRILTDLHGGESAYTWVVTVSVAGSAIGGALAGAIVDQPGGLPWAFVFAAAVLVMGAMVAGVPGGPMARADERAADRLRRAEVVVG